MIGLSRSLILGLALVMSARSAPSPASAGTPASAADRPFKGYASGTILSFPVAGAPGIAQYNDGRATHLGRLTRTEYFFLGAQGEVYGWMVYTAANGDHLWLDFDGQFVSPTTAVGTYKFTGGTGRFADATGTASFVAVVDAQGHVEASFDGSIRY